MLLEAAAEAVPLLPTNVGGTPEMLIDGESALLVPVDNAPAVAAAMIRAFGDASLRSRIAALARPRIAERFSIGRLGEAAR